MKKELRLKVEEFIRAELKLGGVTRGNNTYITTHDGIGVNITGGVLAHMKRELVLIETACDGWVLAPKQHADKTKAGSRSVSYSYSVGYKGMYHTGHVNIYRHITVACLLGSFSKNCQQENFKTEKAARAAATKAIEQKITLALKEHKQWIEGLHKVKGFAKSAKVIRG